MGDPITIALMAGGAAMQAVSSIKQGQAQKAQLEAEAQTADLQAVQVTANAAAAEAERKQRLRDVLASQSAIFASRGIDIGSGTPETLAQASMAEEARESRAANVAAGIESKLLQGQASSSRAAKRGVMQSALWSAGGSLLSGAAAAYSIGSAPKIEDMGMTKTGKPPIPKAKPKMGG